MGCNVRYTEYLTGGLWPPQRYQKKLKLSHNSTCNSSIFSFDNVSNLSVENRKKEDYKQKILLSTDNTIEFDLFLEDQLQRFHTVSTVHFLQETKYVQL